MQDVDRQTIRLIVANYPAIIPHLEPKALIIAGLTTKATAAINKAYHDAITQSLINYFEGGPVGASRNAFKNAMITAFGDSFDAGWTDGGGELPIEDEDALGWLEGRLNEEAAYIDGLFDEAKQKRKEKDFDYFSWASQKADSYTASLLSIYNAAKMLLDKKQMLTWHLGATEKHCKDCAKLDGKRHKAGWFIAHNYIPRQPGAAMECGGYNCDCSLTDANGDEVTL
jgi:hypothetical protein